MAECIYIFVMVYCGISGDTLPLSMRPYRCRQGDLYGVRAVEWEVSSRYTRLPAPDCTLANYVAELFPTRNYSDYSAPLHVIGFPGTESRTTDVRSPTTGHEICRSNIYRAIVSYCSRLCGTAGRPH